MANWNRDVRFGLRMLARNKGFTAVAILALALGIGPNVAIFSIIWATFLAPLPYPNAKQLAVVWSHYKGERNGTGAADFAEWAARSQSFQKLDFQSWNAKHLTNADHSQDETSGLLTTPGFYTKDFGLPMAMGRDFLPDEGTPGKDHLAIITHRLWMTRYNSDPQIIGKPILIDDEAYTVVGVLPEGPMDKVEGTQFIVPYIPKPGVPSNEYGNVFGRLKPGVTLAQAQAEVATIDSQLAPKRNGPEDAKSWSVSVEQLKNDWLDPKLMRNMWLLLAAVSLVLLIACANVANLLLARGSARQQELALRSAMGASRRQVFAQLLTESLTLAVVGGGIGVALGWAIMKLAMAILPLEKQVAEAVVGLNVPVLCFGVGVTLMGGVLFGCAPALQAAKVSLSETLKQGFAGDFRAQPLGDTGGAGDGGICAGSYAVGRGRAGAAQFLEPKPDRPGSEDGSRAHRLFAAQVDNPPGTADVSAAGTDPGQRTADGGETARGSGRGGRGAHDGNSFAGCRQFPVRDRGAAGGSEAATCGGSGGADARLLPHLWCAPGKGAFPERLGHDGEPDVGGGE
jgi:putative ABC transport system permease protein